MTREAVAPAQASVVAVLLRDFSRQPVLEQARLNAALQKTTEKVLKSVARAERIVVEVPEGLALVLLGGPAAALEVAERLQATAGELAVSISVNHGPIKLLEGAGSTPHLLGDGLDAAVTLAKLATRGRMLLTRAFRDALDVAAPHRAAGLAAVGAFTDANVRSHELFTLDPKAASARRRRVLTLAGLAMAGMVAAGVGVRISRTQAALIRFDISPEGTIFVDGDMKGVSPPLRELKVPPGRHTIEVRHATQAPLKLSVTVEPGQEMAVTHSFAVAKPRPRRDESFIGQMRRKLGL